MLPCLRQSPSHLVTEWLHGPFPSWRGQTPHSPWSVNTLWIPSWPILLWPVRPSVNSQMSYSPMASPRVFTAPDQGNDFTAKGIHQWTQAHGIKSPPPGNSWPICKKVVWGSKTVFPLSWDRRLPPGPLGFSMSLNWNERKSLVLSSEEIDLNY